MEVLKHKKLYLRRTQFKILQPLQSAHLQKSEKDRVLRSREIVYGGSMDMITGQTKTTF